MGYYVATIIAIFPTKDFDSREKVKEALKEILRDSEENYPIDSDDPGHCLSDALIARKGGLFVIAGVFNHWHFYNSAPFACLISQKLKTTVFLSSWDMEENSKDSIVYDYYEELKRSLTYEDKLIIDHNMECIKGGLKNDEYIFVPREPDSIVSQPYIVKKE